MSKEKNLNLSEAALEILNTNVKTKDASQDKFGQGEKLKDTVNKSASDIGSANFAEYDLKDVPTATAPGATPPVGAEPIKKLAPQPAETSTAVDTKVDQLPKKGKFVNEEEEVDETESEEESDDSEESEDDSENINMFRRGYMFVGFLVVILTANQRVLLVRLGDCCVIWSAVSRYPTSWSDSVCFE